MWSDKFPRSVKGYKPISTAIILQKYSNRTIQEVTEEPRTISEELQLKPTADQTDLRAGGSVMVWSCFVFLLVLSSRL